MKRCAAKRDAQSEDRGDHSVQEDFAAASISDRRIRINVGGEYITTLARTLCSEPSLLSEWVKNDFAGIPRDSLGNPFIDRDPENFRQVINYLRGYGLPASTERIIFLAEDAEYYKIDKLMALINPQTQWKFLSGPGISENQKEFSTENILATCGTEPLPPEGRAVFSLRVEKCDIVTIGLIGAKNVRHNVPLEKQVNTISFRNSGDLVRHLSCSCTFKQSTGYKSHDIVEVHVSLKPDAPAQVNFYCNGGKVHETDWPSPVPPLRFAVSLHGASVVIIEKCTTVDVGESV
ncbi:unnamed protein product [Trypanosoma congolense IL3000]|uniref:Uncharacterized protein TCIL3000_11_8590 n=1 Tax=Trypanosoma congolense (strain IL3000) TaxID=1068625 RepID=F9WJK4_TRYCI|nr:unnamed protein product [Trypanosoma congolense IL3000]CCD17509.1 unnamed protein product [Trypanosoma congolense IL3000]